MSLRDFMYVGRTSLGSPFDVTSSGGEGTTASILGGWCVAICPMSRCRSLKSLRSR